MSDPPVTPPTSVRPKRQRHDPRTATAVRFTPDLHRQLQEAADERDVSINWIVNRAVAQFLDRLIPVDEWKLTR